MKVCVTGATGFVGAHVAAKLVAARRRGAGHGPRPAAAAGAGGPRRRGRGRRRARPALDAAGAGGLRRAVPHRRRGRLPPRRQGLARERGRAPDRGRGGGRARGCGRVVVTSSVASIGPALRRPGGHRAQPVSRPAARACSTRTPSTRGRRRPSAPAERAGHRGRVGVSLLRPRAGLQPRRCRARPRPGSWPTTCAAGCPAIVDAYTNIVDVEDVAQGHLLAAERGQAGRALHPRRREPALVGGGGPDREDLRRPASADRAAAGGGGRRRRAASGRTCRSGCIEGIRLMAPDWRYSSARARRELGYRPRRANETLRRTVDWYTELIEDDRLAAVQQQVVRRDDRGGADGGPARPAGCRCGRPARSRAGGPSSSGPVTRWTASFPATSTTCGSRCARPSARLEHDDVPIGAVIVRDGEVLAAACNERELRKDPTAHAEMLVLREAGRKLGGWRIADVGPVRDDRAVRDVRGSDRVGAGAARRLRRARPEGGRGRERAERAGRAAPQLAAPRSRAACSPTSARRC